MLELLCTLGAGLISYFVRFGKFSTDQESWELEAAPTWGVCWPYRRPLLSQRRLCGVQELPYSEHHIIGGAAFPKAALLLKEVLFYVRPNPIQDDTSEQSADDRKKS